ncbi:MAG TPA: Hpt domain-containing protein [Steroidobacteraceae bacterium]|nr:Hpt domain-containing protein [Steroidobacteraceae bacterium]
MAPQVASQTLDAVAREVTASLAEARMALEAYVEQTDNVGLLQKSVAELAQVQGVLRVMEIHGAALLAEEMHQVCQYLAATAKEKKNQNEALDALMRAMVQLPGYLDRVLAGGRDMALVLLPLLNDMRAVRGSPLLSEGTLLSLNLKSDQQAAPQVHDDSKGKVSQLARKARSRYQMALIGWIRGERVDHHLENLATVAEQFERTAETQPLFQLWWVTGAVIEALRDRGLESGVSVKRLLGLADREIKRLHEQGEARFAQHAPVELLNNLLYYVARSTSSGPRVSAVRASFRLGELLPVDDSIEQERENLSAPSVKLMQTVAVAIREDLAKVKDVLDIYVRRGGAAPDELAPQVDMLRKIGDTLGVLGLGEQRARVQGEIARLEGMIAAREPPTESALIDIAASLIHIEDHLDDELVGMILPRRMGSAAAAPDVDFQVVQSAVLRECVVNLARVKEYIGQNVVGALDAAGFDNWQDLMRGIQAGLLMLGKTRAVQNLERVTGHLKKVMRQGGSGIAPSALERLADAIVSIEYYMDTLQAGRSDPWYMLDNAEAALDAVDQQPLPAVPTVAPIGDVRIPTGTLVLDRGAPPAREPAVAPVLSAATGRVRPRAEPADPELIALFLEEAREEQARIARFLPEWDQDPSREDVLVSARRAFHTLKGSGRVVGALELAEFAWSIENLLNRLLDKTMTRSQPILGVLREAVAVLPQLIRHLDEGIAPQADIPALCARANALAAGKVAGAPPAESTRIEMLPEPPAAVAPPAPAPPAPEPEEDDEPTLRDIYSRETDSHVATVRGWIEKVIGMPGVHVLPESVYRACHTLSGSSKMAEARHGIRLAEPLNHWLRKAFDSSVGLQHEDLSLLESCMTAMESVSRNLDETTGFFLTNDALLERIARADTALDRRIATDETGNNQQVATTVVPEPAAQEPAAAEVGDYDPEIASIFSEEATELLEASQSSFQGISLTEPRREQFAELKRPLHTLKGGARMAGLTAMGDLAHELESLIIGIEVGGVPPSREAREALQSSLDELAHMRDLLAQGRPVAAVPRLLSQVRALYGAMPELEEAPPPAAPVAPAPEADAAVLTAAAEPEQASAPAEVQQAPDEESPQPERVVEVEFRHEAASAAPTSVEPPRRPPAFERLMASVAVPPGREPSLQPERAEMARVDAELLNQLLNQAGEVSIARSRVEQQLGSVEFNLAELSRTVTRLKEQLSKLEIETEAQILHRHETETGPRADFDPLELDRYSSIQQFSRALAETASDVASIQSLLESLTGETQNLLLQQGRTITEMQNGLMRTRMVSFQRHVQRLSRIVRQTAADTGKKVELLVEGASGELDRQVLERMLPPFEHLLRNAVVHGIESPEQRIAAGKTEAGQILLTLRREGAEVIVDVRDDGAGMNIGAIRSKAISLGLIREDQALTDEEAMQLVLEPGFSTAENLTQAAGRGVGMDVVATEVKKLGGALHMETEPGKGSRFTIRLPFTLAVSHALIVRIADEYYALPLPTVEGVVRIAREEIQQHMLSEAPSYLYGGHKYRFQHLGHFVGMEPGPLPEQEPTLPVVLVRAGELSTGLVAEELIGSREIVVKPVGPQIASIRGVSGATILGDGRIVVILDIGALVRAGWRGKAQAAPVPRERLDRRIVALVVDDSITVRRVTQRLLERNGMRVLTARDGADAVAVMEENVPDVVLLDIEMPRMDGYEVAAHMRADERLKRVPIIMITSRVGEKHRARALELGVDEYLGKPYQESQLLEAIAPLVGDEGDSIAANGR